MMNEEEQMKFAEMIMDISKKDKDKGRAFCVFGDFMEYKHKAGKDKPKFRPSKEFLKSLDEKQYKEFSEFVQGMYAENMTDEIFLIEFIFAVLDLQEGEKDK